MGCDAVASRQFEAVFVPRLADIDAGVFPESVGSLCPGHRCSKHLSRPEFRSNGLFLQPHCIV